jgi:hypothetical protein
VGGHWAEQLRQLGVSNGRLRAGAVHARSAFEVAVEQYCKDGPSWVALKGERSFEAPDPWRAQEPTRWTLASLQVVNLPAPGRVWGLMRHREPFFHPLPLALVARWQSAELQLADLPPMAAGLQGVLAAEDFVDAKPSLGLMPFMATLLAVGALAMVGAILWAEPGASAATVLGFAGLPAAGAALISVSMFRLVRRRRRILKARPPVDETGTQCPQP